MLSWNLSRTQNKITANYEIKARKEKELRQKDGNGRKKYQNTV